VTKLSAGSAPSSFIQFPSGDCDTRFIQVRLGWACGFRPGKVADVQSSDASAEEPQTGKDVAGGMKAQGSIGRGVCGNTIVAERIRCWNKALRLELGKTGLLVVIYFGRTQPSNGLLR